IGSICLLVVLVVFLTLSGVIDFFVVANDRKGTIADVGNSEIATWILKNTPPSSVFLNSSYIYHPASLAGRKIFLGWPYFAWSAGYSKNRMPIMKEMYENSDNRCQLFDTYDISFITVQDVNNDPNLPNIDLSYFLKSFSATFVSGDKTYAIFTKEALCSGK
ncbi:hypothetical protein HY409_00910, partial [Candidatus Gottesmanbacteria bacterium]|nr:hypothetical protein [Candidatus Gottesmanbacteria bacterium]